MELYRLGLWFSTNSSSLWYFYWLSSQRLTGNKLWGAIFFIGFLGYVWCKCLSINRLGVHQSYTKPYTNRTLIVHLPYTVFMMSVKFFFTILPPLRGFRVDYFFSTILALLRSLMGIRFCFLSLGRSYGALPIGVYDFLPIGHPAGTFIDYPAQPKVGRHRLIGNKL